MSCDTMIIAKFHRSGGEMLLAACDSELFGKCLESDELKFDLGSEFYNGEEVTEDEFCGVLVPGRNRELLTGRTYGIFCHETLLLRGQTDVSKPRKGP